MLEGHDNDAAHDDDDAVDRSLNATLNDCEVVRDTAEDAAADFETDEALLRDVDVLLACAASPTSQATTASPTSDAGAVSEGAVETTARSSGAIARAASRRRQKEELEYLRVRVKELEQELADLQSGAAAPTPPPGSTMPVWQRLAKNQQAEMYKVQLENTKLREMLERHIRMAHSLEKILRKRPTPEDVDAATNKRHRTAPTPTTDDAIHTALAANLDTLQLYLSQVFEDAGIAHLATELCDGRVKGTMATGLFIERVDCRLVPFPVHEIGAMVFQVFSKPRMDLPNGHISIVDASSDTIANQGMITTKLRRTEVTIKLQMVFKRIVEAEREMFVWRSLSSTEGATNSVLRGVTFQECGWGTIEQVGATSMIKCCARMVPMLPGAKQQGFHQVGLLSDLLLDSYEQTVSVLHQHIENAMMEALLERM